MLRTLFSFCFLLCFFASTAQSIDSLQLQLAKEKEDTSKVKLLNKLAAAQANADPEEARNLAEQALQLAEKIDFQVELARSCNILGVALIAKGDYSAALVQLLRSLKIREALGDKGAMAISNIWIGNLYTNKEDYASALHYYQQALQLQIDVKDEKGAAYTYGNLSLVYIHQQAYEEAKKVNQRSLELHQRFGNERAQSSCYNNFGSIAFNQAQYAEAYQHFKACAAICERLQDQVGLVDAKINTANSELKLNQIRSAIISYQQALSLCDSIDYLRGRAYAYEGLSEAYEEAGNYQTSLSYFKLAGTAKDSLLNQQSSAQINELQARFETEKKDRQILEQESELQKRRYQLIALGVFLSLVLISGVLLYNSYKSKQELKLVREVQHQEKLREKAIKEREEQERQRISKDMHDELGSGLSKISILSGLIKGQTQDAALADKVDSISKTSRELAQNMRDLIWALNPERSTLEDLFTRIREYTNAMLENLPIEINRSFPSGDIDFPIREEAQHHLFLAIKEGIHNALKHGDAQAIDLDVQLDEEHLFIHISDDGKGFYIDGVSRGNGLNNMEERLQNIGGRYEIESVPGKGTCIKLTVSLEALCLEV